MAVGRRSRTDEGFLPQEAKKGRRDRRASDRKNTTDIIFWNVAGVSTLSRETWEEIKKFEIIGLTETWLEENNEKILDRHLQEYNWETIAAKRIRKKGRARGGMLLAMRKETELVRQKREESDNKENEIIAKTVKIEGKDIRIIATYMREKRKEKWVGIEEEVEKNKGS